MLIGDLRDGIGPGGGEGILALRLSSVIGVGLLMGWSRPPPPPKKRNKLIQKGQRKGNGKRRWMTRDHIRPKKRTGKIQNIETINCLAPPNTSY